MAKLRMGMIGGGPGSFIGRIHRMAAELDGDIQLVCGAFSSDPEKSKAAGAAMHLDPARVYGSYVEMIESEQRLPANQRMDFVAIVTPNHVHYQPAMLALQGGFDVVVDKPMCFSLDEARSLEQEVERTGRLLAVTYTYSGYPMVKEMRAIIAAGRIGKIRKVYVEYPQGWLATDLETGGNKQADWRTDPKRSGAGGAIGDIGTHAAHLAEYATGLRITAINAMLNTVVPGRRLDDDASMLLRFNNDATGVLTATQVAVGEENNLNIRIYGEKGGLEWHQVEPNSAVLQWPDQPREILRAGWGYLGSAAQSNTRTPPGHPEGYLEAFANIYAAFARALRSRASGDRDFPTVVDGARGMAFIDCVIRSAGSSQKWTEMP
ncbi:Gfo/Idh/MocA family protein [Steroidobacter flavus]|uniref:Gfo/Idh/MocA family protein n=1 Tax=Steroidobacter flavus TaxID=1842136 RepID=A0ABV8SZJ2_9GAMM